MQARVKGQHKCRLTFAGLAALRHVSLSASLIDCPWFSRMTRMLPFANPIKLLVSVLSCYF